MDLSPLPILDAAEHYRGEFVDLHAGQVLTTAGFHAARAELARKLADAGIGSGDRIVVAVANGPAVDAQVGIEIAIFYPAHPSTPPQPALRARLAGAGMPRLVEKSERAVPVPEVSGHWIAHAGKDYAPPSLEMLKYFGRGLMKDSLSPGFLIRVLNKIF